MNKAHEDKHDTPLLDYEHDTPLLDYGPDPRLLSGWNSLVIDFWLGIVLGAVLFQLLT